jgi:hypothetical protein
MRHERARRPKLAEFRCSLGIARRMLYDRVSTMAPPIPAAPNQKDDVTNDAG